MSDQVHVASGRKRHEVIEIRQVPFAAGEPSQSQFQLRHEFVVKVRQASRVMLGEIASRELGSGFAIRGCNRRIADRQERAQAFDFLAVQRGEELFSRNKRLD